MTRWMTRKICRRSGPARVRLYLYLTLALCVMLILSSADEVKYDNQRAFLKAAGHASTDFADFDEFSSLRPGQSCVCMDCLTGELVVPQEERGSDIYRYEAPAQVYRVPDPEADLELTPFTAANLDGCDPGKLKEAEVILSFDLARRLHVKAGGCVRFVPWTGEESAALRVAGIMKTKYRYQEIGRTGTALVCLNERRFRSLADDAQVCIFRPDRSGELSKEEELEECRGSGKVGESTLDAVFPLMGFLLLFLVLVRECRRISRKYRQAFALLYREGYDLKNAVKILFFLMSPVVLASTVSALFLYCALFMDRLAGEQIRLLLGVRMGVTVFLLQMMILTGVLNREGKNITDR